MKLDKKELNKLSDEFSKFYWDFNDISMVDHETIAKDSFGKVVNSKTVSKNECYINMFCNQHINARVGIHCIASMNNDKKVITSSISIDDNMGELDSEHMKFISNIESILKDPDIWLDVEVFDEYDLSRRDKLNARANNLVDDLVNDIESDIEFN